MLSAFFLEEVKQVSKKEIRQQIIERLNNLSAAQKKEQENSIYELLFGTEQWEKAEVVALTLSQKLELTTYPIIEKAWKEGKTVVVPRTKKNREMDFVKYSSTTPMETSSFGLQEPLKTLTAVPKSKIDLVIVPGLAYSEKGYRIGFGGGYYDRFLADYKGTTLSLVFKEQEIRLFPVETFDIPIDFLITAEKVTSCRNKK